MEVYIRRYFWVIGVIVVILCAVFAAYGVNHFVEAKFLADRKEAVNIPRVASASSSTEATRSKSGKPIVTRNMFCSECVLAEVTTTDGPIVDSNAPPATSLPLRLVATNISTDASSSFVTVENTSSGTQGAFWIGNAIPGAGEILRINGRYVDFKNKTAGRVERLSLFATAPAPVAAAKTTAKKIAKSDKKSARDELLAAIDDGVKKSGDNAWDIDRSVVDKVLSNPTAVGRGARIVPSIKNGQPNGFKLYAIRPSSVYSKIGLMNGDTIHSVNGFDLTTPDKALEVYTKVRESNNLTVTVTRRGKPVTLKYSIK